MIYTSLPRRKLSRHDAAAPREQYTSWDDAMDALNVYLAWATEQTQLGFVLDPPNQRYRIWSIGPNKWLCTRTDYPSPATRWRTEK